MSRPRRSPPPWTIATDSSSSSFALPTAEAGSPSPTSPPPLAFNDIRARFEQNSLVSPVLTQLKKGENLSAARQASASRTPCTASPAALSSQQQIDEATADYDAPTAGPSTSPQTAVKSRVQHGRGSKQKSLHSTTDVNTTPNTCTDDYAGISSAPVCGDESQMSSTLPVPTAETILSASGDMASHQAHPLELGSRHDGSKSRRLQEGIVPGRGGPIASPGPSNGSDGDIPSTQKPRRPPPPRPPKHLQVDQSVSASHSATPEPEDDTTSPHISLSALRSHFEGLRTNDTSCPPEASSAAPKSHILSTVSLRVPPPLLDIRQHSLPPLSSGSDISQLPSGLTAALDWADASSEASVQSAKPHCPRSASSPMLLDSISAEMSDRTGMSSAKEAESHTKLEPPPLRRGSGATPELQRAAALVQPPPRPAQRAVSAGSRTLPIATPQANGSSKPQLAGGSSKEFAPPLLRSARHSVAKGTNAPASSDSDSSECEDQTVDSNSTKESSSIKNNGSAAAHSFTSHSRSVGLAEVLPDTSRANRRPPAFVPPRYAQSKHFQCFAAWGHTIATASGDKVRIYRVGATAKHSDGGDKLCSLAAEHGGKEVKVTAMAFRPSGGGEPDGRYLWCGTREGTLCEMDIVRATVQSSKHNLHTAPVIILQRVGSGMLSMDESGKICVWLPQTSQGSEGNEGTISLSQSPFAQRVTLEKSTVVLALGAQLWACSGSLVTHGTSFRAQQGQSLASAASAKVAAVGFGTSPNRAASPASAATTSKSGHKLRIFEPFATTRPFNATSRPIGLGTFGIAGVGAVTSGTIMPEWPHRKYLAHDTGHISVWDSKTLACLGLQRVSVLGFTAICGVSNLLWTGNRSGRITIYAPPPIPSAGSEGNSQLKSWKVVKSWPAHKGSILSLALDPASLHSGYSDDGVAGIAVVSAGIDHCVHIWDGLLSSDWLAHQVSLRNDEFSTYRSLRSLHVTFNIDAASPSDLHASVESLDWLPRLLKSAISTDGQRGPEIIYFGFQEIVDLEDKRLTAKSMLLNATVKKGKADGERISHQYRLWYDRLVLSVRLAMPADCPYRVVHSQSMVGLFSCVFVQANEYEKLSDEAVVTVKTGLGGRWGNKGSIVSRFSIDDTSCVFINAHLAAGQRHVKQRNDDIAQILEADTLPMGVHGEGLYVDGGSGELILDHELVFLGGDLNYRIDLPRSQVLSCINSGRLDTLLRRDQLHQELQRNSPLFRLRGFQEADCPTNFAPTYKFDAGTQDYDTSDKGRIPAWCDRLLFRCASQSQGEYDDDNGGDSAKADERKRASVREASSRQGLRCLEYRSWPEVTISDHKPVSAVFEFQVKRIDWELRDEVKREEEANAEERRARLVTKALRYFEEAGWRWSVG